MNCLKVLGATAVEVKWVACLIQESVNFKGFISMNSSCNIYSSIVD
jgi:hypothetical protein